MIEWSTDPPIPGEWYWLADDEGAVVGIGKCDPRSAGGWTNEDTWEDFSQEVVRWARIPRPRIPEGSRLIPEGSSDERS